MQKPSRVIQVHVLWWQSIHGNSCSVHMVTNEDGRTLQATPVHTTRGLQGGRSSLGRAPGYCTGREPAPGMTKGCSAPIHRAQWQPTAEAAAPLTAKIMGNPMGATFPLVWGHWHGRVTELLLPPQPRTSDLAAWEATGSSSAQTSSLLPPMTHELVSKYFLYSWQNLKPNFPSLLQMQV